jgi:hypothetical protein
MTDRGVEAFVEAVLADRRPKHFRAALDDTEVLRVALQLRASRSEFAGPDPNFVEDLHRQLAGTGPAVAAIVPLPIRGRRRRQTERVTPWPDSGSGPSRTVRPRFAALGKAAAAAALVASTFTATNLIGAHSPAPVAQQAPNASTVRSGDLLTAAGRPLGRAYAYGGNPSWVFMDVHASDLNGMYTCELQLTDGTTVPAGVVMVYHGTGDWAHTVTVQAGQVQRATLVTSTGVTVASATFS